MIRMVIDVTPEMHQRVESLLEDYHRRGRLAYGLHVSETALMTCLVKHHKERPVHFIDGGDGGYALAAKGLKARLSQSDIKYTG